MDTSSKFPAVELVDGCEVLVFGDDQWEWNVEPRQQDPRDSTTAAPGYAEELFSHSTDPTSSVPDITSPGITAPNTSVAPATPASAKSGDDAALHSPISSALPELKEEDKAIEVPAEIYGDLPPVPDLNSILAATPHGDTFAIQRARTNAEELDRILARRWQARMDTWSRQLYLAQDKGGAIQAITAEMDVASRMHNDFAYQWITRNPV